MRHSLTRVILGLMLVTLLSAAFAVSAQQLTRDPSSITDDEINAIASKMFCMECENIPLDVCGTRACHQWREEIRMQMAEGKSEAEILEYFRVNHGERALAIPQDPLLRGLTNITPLVFAVLGVFIAGWFLWRWQSKPASPVVPVGVPPTDAPTVTPENPYLSQIEQDLKKS